nr:PhzF family phenazine biosynthesis protein [uncultured Holophaga sp.]
MSHSFQLVDVFTSGPQSGNPLAVVFEADDLPVERMQAFAQWMNLSETAFLMAPTHPAADYRVRIFTPRGEMAFAGHPTLGSCHAWLSSGEVPGGDAFIVQECGVGLVRLRRRGDDLAFAAPPLRMEEVVPAMLARVQSALGLLDGQVLAACSLDNGAPWLALLLDSAASVLAVEPDWAALAELPELGLVGPHGADHFEVRAFAVPSGIPEDPVTGSLNAALGQWLMGEGRAPRTYTVSQGTRLGRAGRVSLDHDGQDLWVGGAVRTDVTGALDGGW